MIARFATLVVLALVLAGCGDAGDPPATTPATTQPPATTVAPTTTNAPTTTTSTTPTSTTVAPTTTAGTPGEPYDLFVPTPAEGPVIGVVAVAFDDTLNVRSGPGVGFDVVGELQPTAMAIAGTGAGWQLPSGAVWWEIDTGQLSGWANSRFLARLDGTDDVTAQVVAQLGGIPSAETMLDLGTLVADVFVDADVGSEVVQVTAPTVGDAGEVTFDVVGLADDSVRGVRLHIFGEPGDESFTLRSVEATAFCTRGLAEGICV